MLWSCHLTAILRQKGVSEMELPLRIPQITIYQTLKHASHNNELTYINVSTGIIIAWLIQKCKLNPIGCYVGSNNAG